MFTVKKNVYRFLLVIAVGVFIVASMCNSINTEIIGNISNRDAKVEEDMDLLPVGITTDILSALNVLEDEYHIASSVVLAKIIQMSIIEKTGELDNIAKTTHNLFKLTGKGKGTVEINGVKYRKYKTYKESISDYLKLLERRTKRKPKRIMSYTKTLEFLIAKRGMTKQQADALEEIILMYGLSNFDRVTDFTEGSGVASGSYSFPCPKGYVITARFGRRTNAITGRGEEMHNGVDIANKLGTPIYAIDGGTVELCGYYGAAGYMILINHGKGVKSEYMHLMSTNIRVKVGSKVDKGQQIARMGSTGRSTGSHLHLGLRVNGRYVDPLKYVSSP